MLNGLGWLLAAGSFGADHPPFVPIEKIRSQMAETLIRIPNYTCTETIERVRIGDDCPQCEVTERLRVEVLVDGKREVVTWPGGSKFEDKEIYNLVDHGTTVMGHFAGFATAIFASDAPSYRYPGPSTLAGKPVLQYDYAIAASKSTFRMTIGDLRTFVGHRGTIFVNPRTEDVTRLEVRAQSLPDWLGLNEAQSSIDYSRVAIGGEFFLMPQATQTVLRYKSGAIHRNSTRYSSCRQYAAASTIWFEAEEQPGERTSRKVEPAPGIPAGIYLDTQLERELDLGSAAIGDPVLLRVAEPSRGEKIEFARHTRIHGTISHLEVMKRKAARTVIVALRLSAIEADGRRRPVKSRLSSLKWPGRQRGLGFVARGEEAILKIEGSDKVLPRRVRFYWMTLE
jgi:hypothetical protein